MEPEDAREEFRGRLIRVDVETWAGRRREVVRHPGACAILATTPDGGVVLVRQFREAVRRALLEIPAGLLDHPGEAARDCAARELLEETGYRAGELLRLGSLYSSPGFTDERIELFAAEARREGAPEKGIEVVLMPTGEAIAAVRDGEITDAKTVAALLLLAQMRGSGRSGAGDSVG